MAFYAPIKGPRTAPNERNGKPANHMESVLAIDPGPLRSHAAVVWISGGVPRVIVHAALTTDAVIELARRSEVEAVVIEQITSYGMPVGQEVFDTCVVIGRIVEACTHNGVECHLIPRYEVKRAILGRTRGTDGEVWKGVIGLCGGASAVGRKGNPGPLYGVHGHCRQAVALGISQLNACREYE